MKRKCLLALVLAGALIFGNAPITANAASPNAGGAIVGGAAADAGDALGIGDAGVPAAAPAVAAADAGDAGGAADAGDAGDDGNVDAPLVAGADDVDIGDENAPLAAPEESTPEDTPEDVALDDDETPLAVLSSETQPRSGFSWWGFWLGVLTMGIVETAVVLVLKSRKKEEK